ncbi:hypothetical protein [Rickettsiella endosymbiont of Dermanyssus gallinae]|uniref:hypothetical protein n=1 Tax=Rickettsiella endosymbiont of Dermanyssus gallinae TaxID=2856608 RepID=UPI001C527AEE|nr:hypothetical protein [Rickettsiella endosymbiont of Dermanyssus gallinae]
MPRFTLIEVVNFPEHAIDLIALPIYLQRGVYRHRDDIDCASETEIKELVENLELPEPTITRMIVEYEDIGDNRRLINSLTVKNYFLLGQHYIPFRNPRSRILLFTHTDQVGRMYSGMLPAEMLVPLLRARANRLREQQRDDQDILRTRFNGHVAQRPRIPETPPIITINSAQNTHIPSVRQSVIEAIKKLQARYQGTLNETNSIDQLEAMLIKLKPNAFYLAPSIIRGAKQSINSLTRIAYEIESGSGLTVNYITALVWTAINDNDKGVLLVEKEEALKRLVYNLFEIQRGGNLDEQGNDNGEVESPICFRGTINKLVDTLHIIHSDVQIIYASKESALLKFPALLREYAINFIKNSTKKTILFEQMKRNKEGDGYPIPGSVLTGIKEEVEKNFKDEFKAYLSNQDLDEIFSSYGCVNLTENNFNAIKIFIDKECAEKIAVFRMHINKLSEHLRASDMAERNKHAIERLNNALTDMLDGLMEVVNKEGGADEGYYVMFKRNFSQLLNENALFASSSTLEILRQQTLMLLNRLIEILIGKKIASISSGTALFKQKQALQLSLKTDFEYAINHLSIACSR